MSLFEFMTWAEVARGNELLEEQNTRLEEMRYEQRAEAERTELEQRENTLVREFEKLYKSGGDIDVVQMHRIIELKGFINSEYNMYTRRYYRRVFRRPNYKRRFLPIAIALSAMIYLAPSLLPYSHLYGAMFAIAVYFFYRGVSNMINDIKVGKANAKQLKEYEEDAAKAARLLKVQFPELSAYGIYLKWFLDQRILHIADVLAPLYPQYNQHKMIKKFYLLFDLRTSAFRHYDDKFIHHMDGYFVKHFQNNPKETS